MSIPFVAMSRKRPSRVIEDDLSGDDEPEYEVEDILGHRRVRRGRIEYLIKWRGYPIEQSSWEFESNLTNCRMKLNDYNDSLKNRAGARSSKKRGNFSKLGVESRGSNDRRLSPPPAEVDSTGGNARCGLDRTEPPDLIRIRNVTRNGTGRWDDGCYPTKVLGVTKFDDGSLWVAVAWDDPDRAEELVRNYVVNEKIPHLMIEYYQSHYTWSDP